MSNAMLMSNCIKIIISLYSPLFLLFLKAQINNKRTLVDLFIVRPNYAFSIQRCLPKSHKNRDQNSCYSDLSYG